MVAVLNGLARFLRSSRAAFLIGGSLLGALLLLGLSWLKEPIVAVTLCAAGVRCGTDCETGLGLALVMLVCGGAFAGLAGYVLAEMGSRVAASSAAKVPPENGACSILVTGLSVEKDTDRISAIRETFRADFAGFALPGKLFSSSPKVVASPDSFMSSWQQTLRAMRYHRPRLKVVMILPSAESLEQWDDHFVPLLRDLCPGVRIGSKSQPAPRRGVATEAEPFADLVVDLVRAPLSGDVYKGKGDRRDYEDYDFVRTGLEAGIEQARLLLPRNIFEQETAHERDICVDITPGLKTFSIAGAIVTLNSDYRLGYVPTGPEGGDVVIYDAQIRFASAPQ